MARIDGWRETATLRAVDQLGGQSSVPLAFAVGDHGTILRSRDGGQNWSMLRSGTSAVLEDVRVLDARHVVAVGGHYEDITQFSHGIVLLSRDGGDTFTQLAGPEIPYLRHIDDAAFGADPNVVPLRGDWSYGLSSDRFGLDPTVGNLEPLVARDHPAHLPPTNASNAIAQDPIIQGSSVQDPHAGAAIWHAQDGDLRVGRWGKIAARDPVSGEFRIVRNASCQSHWQCWVADPARVPWAAIGEATHTAGLPVELIWVHSGAKSGMHPAEIQRDASLWMQAAQRVAASGRLATPDQWQAISTRVPMTSTRVPVTSTRVLADDRLRALLDTPPSEAISFFDFSAEAAPVRERVLPSLAILQSDFAEDALRLVAPLRRPAPAWIVDATSLGPQGISGTRYNAPAADPRTEMSLQKRTEVSLLKRTRVALKRDAHDPSRRRTAPRSLSPSRMRAATARISRRTRIWKTLDQVHAGSLRFDDLEPTLNRLLAGELEPGDRLRMAWQVYRSAWYLDRGTIVDESGNPVRGDTALVETIRASRRIAGEPSLEHRVLDWWQRAGVDPPLMTVAAYRRAASPAGSGVAASLAAWRRPRHKMPAQIAVSPFQQVSAESSRFAGQNEIGFAGRDDYTETTTHRNQLRGVSAIPIYVPGAYGAATQASASGVGSAASIGNTPMFGGQVDEWQIRNQPAFGLLNAGETLTDESLAEKSILERSASIRRKLRPQSAWDKLLSPELRWPVERMRRRPKLDGSDADWSGIDPMACATPSPHTFTRIAMDDHYLYFFLRRERVANDPPPPVHPPASGRDMWTRGRPAVTVSLDLDGDLSAPVQWTVCDDASTMDAVDFDPAWDGIWYAAAHSDADSIAFEIAVQIDSLPQSLDAQHLETSAPKLRIDWQHDSPRCVLPSPHRWVSLAIDAEATPKPTVATRPASARTPR
ncbi:MAG: hypothetical protein AAF958_16710 [Planctomycetota bacterium]